MPGVDPATAIAEAVKEVAAVVRLWFNGQNRKLLADVKRVKGMKEAINEAELCFEITDIVLKDKDLHKRYWKHRRRFNKND